MQQHFRPRSRCTSYWAEPAAVSWPAVSSWVPSALDLDSPLSLPVRSPRSQDHPGGLNKQNIMTKVICMCTYIVDGRIVQPKFFTGQLKISPNPLKEIINKWKGQKNSWCKWGGERRVLQMKISSYAMWYNTKLISIQLTSGSQGLCHGWVCRMAVCGK